MRAWPRILNIFLFTLLTTGCIGQRQIFRSYSMSDGLSNNAIRKIFQDSQGFIWICTWEGLNKFEGNKFTRYDVKNGLPHSMVNDVIELSKGSLMVTMNDGSISYIRNGLLDPHSRKTPFIINQILKEPGRLIGITDSYGVVRIDADTIVRTANNVNYSLYEMIKWKDKYLAIGDPSPVIIFNQQLNWVGQSGKRSTYIHTIYKDRKDRVWIGTETGVKLADLTNEKNPDVLTPSAPFDHPLLVSSQVTAIHEDDEGNLWFGTRDGLISITPAGTTSVFTEKNGLPGNRITCIMSDAEKNLWVGTHSGLAKLSYQSLQLVTTNDDQVYQSPLYSVRPIDTGLIGLCASDGLYGYDMGRGVISRIMKLEKGDPGIPVDGSHPFSVLYKNSVYRWDKVTKNFEPWSRFPVRYNFAAAQYGDMIAAASSGIVLQFKDGSYLSILDSLRMHTLAWDKKGRILAGAWNRSLYRISIDSSAKKITSIEDLSFIPGLSFIRSIFTDRDGNIWAGTRYNGIIVLKEHAKSKFEVHRINLSSGLLSDRVNYITQDREGNIWAGTLAGISKIITTDSSYRVFNFSSAVNFYSEVTSIFELGYREFWGASDNGLYRFRDLQLENTAPLPVYFTSIRIANADSNFVAQDSGSRLKLKYHENYLRFDFASPAFQNEKDLRYSYRLRGSHDTGWSAPSTLHTVEFASLSPGQYIFEVKMKGWNGEYGPVNQFAFSINRPFWRSWWFYLGTALLLVILAYTIIRYRTRQVLKLQKVRDAIATDLHDDIGSSLTNISILSQLSLDSLQEKEETKKFISRIRDEVQSSNQALDDIIWSVNTRNDTLDETLARMRRYVGDVFDNSSTRYHLDFVSNGSGQKLHMEQRRDLFLIFKEALNNIYKHAGANNVWIKVTLLPKRITLSVRDDGAGFDTTVETHRNGLKNMRSRVNKWKGEFRAVATPSGGTCITFTMPVTGK